MEAQPVSSQEDVVLDAKPLRSLAPMFPAPYGFNTTFTSFGSAPAVCVSPFGGSSSSGGGFPPFFFSPEPTNRQKGAASAGRASNRTPAANGSYHSDQINLEDDPDYTIHTTTSGRKIKRPKTLKKYKIDDSDSESAEGSGKRKSQIRRKSKKAPELALIPSSLLDARNSAEEILMTFDALRRKILQLDEANDSSKRSYLRAGAIMMSNDLRANIVKRIGPVPGVEIGDIFYFRIEMCLVGLHAQIMGGIDYMLPRLSDMDEPLAISIVSAGGYENDEGDTNILIYTGQGGGCSSKYDKNQVVDQKLERGNLALERSLHRGNLVRVIRSAKDMNLINGRIYIYDGLYKIQETWVEKAKAGNNVFKYKLFRELEQPEGIAVWKNTEKWKANPSSRGGVILPDISSGIETFPVFLVNEVDNEKGPSHFTYATKVKYLNPINSMRPLPGCRCISVCLPGDASCSCAQQNGGNLPYCANGFVVSRKHVLYECNSLCSCSVNCRNRVTQKGVNLHFEVFRTRDRGWGLRSWDPIRAGTFICEYVGEVVDKIKVNDFGEDDHYIFQGNYIDEKTLKWNHGPELLGEPSINESDVFKPLPIIISSRNVGNVARFMNHSCSPNVFWQPVLHDHNEGDYPHIMFFAMKHIPPLMELTFDYGLNIENAVWNVAGTRQPKKCLCGSPKCRGFFR
ncbi:histone-lysine N-methyltransferase, H3 lysine-9 specific SUVH1 isoform X2 [Dendrobium catenatum]|uniref:histone-lysine N-methyltransferase, H3 lysine-9 specific SUVH1 isoform X1 n=1 Tax=Dendrobium catenatum TaxID=906689 RepID=UPI0009F6EF85|nr:histone-lysine N-methyltransferase, H3 lysine-9 specific SUVH1 isoform X1 [Dendrobium catenatum]XP_028554564.1 histone-lysine N-methyltransferase, H3 lysine-9 specific SUVH1 isoform X2 [Dendrobium catenatum]